MNTCEDERMNTKKYLLGVTAFIIVGFMIAAIWHFILFAQVYDSLKIYTIKPIIPLGFISFILEGFAFVYVFQLFRRGEKPILEGLIFGCVVYGIIMGGVGVLAEGAKHYVTSLSTWLLVEGAFYLITGGIIGAILGLIYGKGD